MKKLLLFSLCLSAFAFIWAQDTVYWCDFDQPSDAGDWLLLNGIQPHYWTIGRDSSMTSNTLFVADVDTFANYYDARYSVTYACHYLTLARGVYQISFDWRCVGWDGWGRPISSESEMNEVRPSNFMRVAMIPGTPSLIPGYRLPDELRFMPTSLPMGYVPLDGGTPLSEWSVSNVSGGEAAPQAGWHTYGCEVVISDSGTYCLVFSWTTDNISIVVQPPAAVDNLLITPIGCPAPANVYVDRLASHSFDLHWTDLSNGRTTQLLVTCCSTSDTSCPDMLYSASDTLIRFTNLLGDMDYMVYLRPLCGADTADTVVQMRIHTPCELISTLPYVQDFSIVDSLNLSPFVPCWTRWGRDSTDMVCVNGRLRWRVSGEPPYPNQYLVLQGVDTSLFPIRNLQLSFQGRGRLLFEVGVMSNPMDTGGFIPVATINRYLSGWENHVVEFNNYRGNGNYIAIRTSFGGRIDASLDNFVIDFAACQSVRTISMADVGTNSAVLTWSVYENTRYEPESFEVWVERMYSSSSTPMYFMTTELRCLLTGLEPGASYRAVVRVYCNNESFSDGSYVTFSTPSLGCLALDSSILDTTVFGADTVRLNESGHCEILGQSIYTAEELQRRGVGRAFVGMDYYYPVGLSNYQISIYVGTTSYNNFNSAWNSSVLWEDLVYGPEYHSVGTADTIQHYTFDQPFMWDGSSNIVVTTMVHLDSVDSTAMLFNGYSSFTGFTGDSMSVCTWRDSLPYSPSNYARANAVGTIRSVYRPSVTFYSIPCDDWNECLSPVGLTIDSVETYAAYLSWLPGYEETGWLVQYRPVDDTVWLVDTVLAGSDTVQVPHCRLDSLAPGQRYEVHVLPDCVGDSIFAQAEFSTLCASINTLPLVEDFEDFVAPNLADGPTEYCWHRGVSRNNISSAPYVDTIFAFSGAKSLHFSSNMPSGYVYIALPPMGIRMDSLQLSFYVYGEEDYRLKVGVMTDPTDYSTFFEVAQVSPVSLHVWELIEVPLEEYSGLGRYIALATEGRQYRGVYLDDLRVDYLPSCPRPLNVSVPTVTDHTAIVQWYGPNALNYEMEYGPAGFAPGTGIRVVNPADSVMLTGLSAATTYDLYLRSLCATDTSTWTLTTQFTTVCGRIDSLPYIKDFHSWREGANGFPACWYSGAGSYYDQPSIVDRTNGLGQLTGHSLLLKSRGNIGTLYGSTYAVMPAIDTARYPLHTLQVTVKADCGLGEYSFDGGQRLRPPYVHKLIVGVSRQPNDIISTFTPVDTLFLTEVPAIYTVPLAAARGAGEYITFVSYRTTLETSNNVVLLDSVVVEHVVSCQRPYNLAAYGITDTSAVLTWQPYGSAIGGQVEYMPHGVALGGGTRVNVIGNTLTINGLSPASSYDFYVRSLCTAQDTSEWCRVPATFATRQIPATVPYAYGFDSVQEWDNWRTLSNTTVNWYRSATHGSPQPPCMYISADSGATPSTHTYEAVNAVAYRDIDFGNIDTTFVLSFSARMGGRSSGSDYYDGLAVLLADPGEMMVPSNRYYQSPWGWLYGLTPLAVIHGDNTWDDYSVLIDSITGIHRLAFYCFDADGNTPFYGQPAMVDNISIDYHYDPCPVPSEVRVSPVTTTTATVSWRGTSDGIYRVLLLSDRTSLLASDTVVGTTYRYTALLPGTSYKVRVSRLCPGYETRPAPDRIFTTNVCDGGVSDTIGNLAYYDFNYTLPVHNAYNYSYTQQIVLASELGGAGEISSINILYTQSSRTMTAKRRCVIYMGHTERSSFSSVGDFEPPDDMQMVYDGQLNCVAGWNRIFFSRPFAYDGTSNLVIAIDDNSGEAQDNAVYYQFATSGTVEPMALVFYSNTDNVNCSSGTSLAAFPGTKSLLNYRTVMSFDVCPPNSCAAPALRAPRVQAGGVTLRWQGTADRYLFGYRLAGNNRWVVDNLPMSDTFYVINDCFFDTDYVYHVRQYCDGESISNWAMGSFNTADMPCLPPLDLRAYDITNKAARLIWTPEDNHVGYRLRVWNSAYDTIVTTYLARGTIKGLNPDTRYYASVQVQCEYMDEPSIWSDTISFVTDVCPDATDLTALEVGGNSVLLDWQCEEGVDEWFIEWGLRGFDQGTGVTVTADHHPFLLTGMTGETTYDIIVRAVCGDDFVSEHWSNRLTITTQYSDINSVTDDPLVQLRPNPTSGDVMLTLPDDAGAVHVNVVDMAGRTQLSYSLPAHTYTFTHSHTNTITITLATSQLPQGAYYVRLTGDHFNVVKKLIKTVGK